jgi:ribosomal protein L37AE/L43A
MTKTETSTLWVCTDCVILLANGDMPPEPTEYAPMALLAGQDVTHGSTEHEGCDNVPKWIGAECDCEVQTFSMSTCDGCGSPLGGERHAVTVWSHEACAACAAGEPMRHNPEPMEG